MAIKPGRSHEPRCAPVKGEVLWQVLAPAVAGGHAGVELHRQLDSLQNLHVGQLDVAGQRAPAQHSRAVMPPAQAEPAFSTPPGLWSVMAHRAAVHRSVHSAAAGHSSKGRLPCAACEAVRGGGSRERVVGQGQDEQRGCCEAGDWSCEPAVKQCHTSAQPCHSAPAQCDGKRVDCRCSTRPLHLCRQAVLCCEAALGCD